MGYSIIYNHFYDLFAGCDIDHGLIENPKGMSQAHFHDDYEIYFLVSGERKYFLSSQISTLKPNYILIIKPNEPHQVTVNMNVPYERYVLYVSPKIMSLLLKEHPSLSDFNNSTLLMLSDSVFKKATELLDEMKYEIKSKDTYAPDMIKTLLAEILILIFRNRILPDDSINKTDIRIQSAINYIIENYNEPISINDCASLCNLSPTHFSKVFHKITALTFKEFLNKIRIEKACELLENTSNTVSEVCQAVGYSSESYFCTSFKQLKNCTPVYYRKSHREKTNKSEQIDS